MPNNENERPITEDLLAQIPDDLVQVAPRRHRGVLKTITGATLVSLGTYVSGAGQESNRPMVFAAGSAIMGVGGILIVSEGQISDRRRRALQNIRERLRKSA
jgi:hypothetical protein